MISNRDVDVFIVGGGPAGLLAAETVASAGYSTLLVEREREVGSPVRTSGATALQTMLDFDIPADLYHLIKRFRICSPHETAVFAYRVPVGCIIDVRGMYQHLAEKAQDKGAVICTGARADKPLMGDDFVTGCSVKYESEGQIEVNSKIVIDASGYRASLSKKAGLHRRDIQRQIDYPDDQVGKLPEPMHVFVRFEKGGTQKTHAWPIEQEEELLVKCKQ